VQAAVTMEMLSCCILRHTNSNLVKEYTVWWVDGNVTISTIHAFLRFVWSHTDG